MAVLYLYGSTEPIYFKVTLAGVGVPSLTFQANDVKVSKDGAAFANASTIGTVAETTAGLGWYKWTPSAASATQAKVLIINVKDDVGTEFDENGIIIHTGGNASAYHSG